ncbi:MAG: glycosyl transferase family protein [Parerythrobacter sp.]
MGGNFTPFEWLVVVQHELLLFAGVFFLIGALDEFAVDCLWLWLRLTGRTREPVLIDSPPAALRGPVALLIPACQEERVIGTTIRHVLMAWPQAELRLFVGCYRNDSATREKAEAACAPDDRATVVTLDIDGPTTKPDCLNRLVRALQREEAAGSWRARMIVIHDAEDMVDPAALGLLDQAIGDVEAAQVPVLPAIPAYVRWIGSHYADEFAESHGKAMVVRDALGAALPLAGVGCALRRDVVDTLAADNDGAGPFAAQSLTEDYELGLAVAQHGGRARFLRYRHPDGRLVATRAFFPATLAQAVRQKARWVHGIAFQSWERMGWVLTPLEIWMRLHDRRGPISALVLAAGYLLLVLSGFLIVAAWLGWSVLVPLTPVLQFLVLANLFSLLWRLLFRACFTAREYGWREGLRAVPRMVVSNIIAIMAGRRAVFAYARTLRGAPVVWDKTAHVAHPADHATPMSAAE